MRIKYFLLALPIFLAVFLIPSVISAHEPRIVTSWPVQISDPEISKVFYDELSGDPRIYNFSSDKIFNLYLNLLVPERSNGSARYNAVVLDADANEPVGMIDSDSPDWKKFYEKFAGDWYMQGPELRQEMPAGNYKIVVFGNQNQGKYALVIGEKEAFPPNEIFNALKVIPRLKKSFFNESPAMFVISVFGSIYLVALLGFGMIIGLAYRFILKRVAKSNVRRLRNNIGMWDRVVRLLIAVAFLVYEICTFWNPFIIIFSGFLFFEAIFGWCGLYAALGKNTCPKP